MYIEFTILAAGIVMIIALAEMIIRNAIELAQNYNLSGTFIGLTVLSIGTSIPEIMTHIIGSINILKDPSTINSLSGLLIGANIGSDIFQQNFILPVIGIVGTIVVVRKNLFTEMGGLIGAALLVLIFSTGGLINRVEGAILLLTYVAYLFYIKKSKISEEFNGGKKLTRKEIILASSLIIIGFIIMAVVADQVLKVSEILVSQLPLSASFFGVILLGVASAMPELTTSLIAIFKKKKDISAGILIGSNITNPLFGIGLGALISTYTVPDVVIFFDLPVKIFTACLIYVFLVRREDLSKVEATVLIALFFIYVIARFIYFPVDF